MNNLIINKNDTVELTSKEKIDSITLNDNSTLYLYEFLDYNSSTNILLKENTKIYWYRFYNNVEGKEEINININGNNSYVETNFSSILEKTKECVININHNSNNTESNINNFVVVNKNASMNLKVVSKVQDNINESKINQDSKIILLNTNKKSIIKPELLINNYKINAKHSAFIGKFTEDKIFYLKTKGLNNKEIYRLLITGFLINKLKVKTKEKEKLIKIIDEFGGNYEF